MSIKFTKEYKARLVNALAKGTTIGVAADRKTMSLTAGGQTYHAKAGSYDAGMMMRALRKADKHVWTVEPVHVTARAVLDVDERFDVKRIRNATAAEASVIGDPTQRQATNAQDFKLVPAKAGRPAHMAIDFASAQAMSNLAAETATRLAEMGKADPDLKLVAITASKLDNVWRARLVRGWNADLDMLLEQQAADEATRVEILLAADGIDLTDSDAGPGLERALAWLAEAGLHPVEGDKPSTSKDALDSLPPRTSDEAERRWKLMRQAKSLSGSIAAVKGLTRGYSTGVVRAELRLFAARTGRSTVRRTSLQNIRKDRRQVLMARPGYTLLSIDLAQAEIRVAAGLSQDPALIEATKGDVYIALAMSLYGVADADAVTPEQRAAAKQALIAVFYGQGKARTARALGITADEAGALIDGVWTAYPVLDEFVRELKRRAGVSQHTLTLGRPVMALPKDRQHIALNLRVQSEANDLLQVRCAEVAAELGEDALYLQIHDELVVEVPVGEEVAAEEVLRRVMLAPFAGVEMQGEVKNLGSRWGK